MKKIILLLILMFSSSLVYAENLREEVTYVNCTSATTFWIKKNDEVKIIKLLGVDTSDGSLNKEIEDFSCSLVKNAQKLEIEYEVNSNKVDKYNQELVYLYVDGVSLASELIKRGYAQVNYIYGDYLYTDELCKQESIAINEKLGIWNYPDIKEAYCKSGVILNNKKEKNDEEITHENDYNYLRKLVFISSIIVVLLIFVTRKK